MWLDALALAALALCAALGAWRGALEGAVRLLGIFVSYALAVAAAASSGPALAERIGVAPWLGPLLAGSLAFAASTVLFSVAAVLVRGVDRRRRAGGRRGGLDRALGAGFGAARGALLVLVVGWLALCVDALRLAGAPVALPTASGATLPVLSGEVAAAGTRALLGVEEPAARLAARVAGSPAAALAELGGVVEHPLVLELQRDAAFWDALASDAPEQALARPSAQRLLGDPELRRALADLGVIEAEVADDPRALRRALGEALRELAPRLRALREDPALRRLAADPEVERMLREGDTLALLSHPAFQGVVERLVRASAPVGG